MEMDIYREQDMLHHIATISVCYGGHFDSKMTTKIQKSSEKLPHTTVDIPTKFHEV
jgi:hypothetical protein